MKRCSLFVVAASIFLINILYADVASKPVSLSVVERTIQVKDKTATVYGIVQPDGTFGFIGEKGKKFDVVLLNTLKIPTSVHWHGLILPNPQDGVANITQYPIYPGLQYRYTFPLLQAGTYWMHSHFQLQEQTLLSAPLILRSPEDAGIADQEVVMFLADFSFKDPEQIFAELKCPKMDMASMASSGPDLTDVSYDAFLTNSRTLEDPDRISVEPNTKVRLRIINGSSATNFFLSLGKLQGNAIAVDGNRIEPLAGSCFELAIAQRMDILIEVPSEGGAFPILAQGEGTSMQTGLLLATRGAPNPTLNSQTASQAGAFNYSQESMLHPLSPLPSKRVSRTVTLNLDGDMKSYVWTINGQMWPNITPVIVKEGERVEIVFNNRSMMSHPMHLHGHVFQVTAINGKPINGAVRDTVLVPPNSSLSIQFDATNPGIWPLHCHVLYHMEAGMMTVVRYDGYVQPLK